MTLAAANHVRIGYALYALKVGARRDGEKAVTQMLPACFIWIVVSVTSCARLIHSYL
jgi:hypothetical protein